MKPQGKLLCLCTDNFCMNETCATSEDGACFEFAELFFNATTKSMESRHVFGCFQSRETGGFYLQCNSGRSPHFTPKAIQCCWDEDYCNVDLNVTIPRSVSNTVLDDLSPSKAWLITLVFLSAIGLLASICAIFIFRLSNRPKQIAKSPSYSPVFKKSAHLNGSDWDLESDVECRDWRRRGNPEDTTGSGKGAPRLTALTIAREVQLGYRLGKGRYGTVYIAKWRGDTVACKTFFTEAENSWKREKLIYETHLLRHENILGYFSADIRSFDDEGVKMILLTQYCEHGSLHDFLKSTCPKFKDAVSLARTAISGLDYLHNAINGTQGSENLPSGKPGIAHCDIKSQNILVKRNLICVIADFGLAVRNEPKELEENSKSGRCFGTVRYMPPEILDQQFNRFSFDSYKLADIYSFSLVLWEITNRCEFNGVISPYKVPYEDMIGCDPKVEDMRVLVSRQNLRPPIAEEWSQDSKMRALSRLIVESWNGKPDARLTARFIKRELTRLEYACNNEKY